MSRSVVSPAQAPIEVQDDSVATTLKVIMDVLKSHEGSIKELRNFLTSHGKNAAVVPPLLNIYDMNEEEEPVKDLHTDDIPDNQSEASSIMSSRTEYHELPTRSTLINSTGVSSAGNGLLTLSDLSHQRTAATSPSGLTSTPAKPYSFPQHRPPATTSFFEQTPKLDLSVSTVHGDEHQGKISLTSSQPYGLHMPPVKLHKGSELPKYSPSPSSSHSVVALSTKIQLLENQVSEWGDIIDEMSDRMANQPSLIRKFAKESTTDKVSYRQHTDDLGELERKLAKRIDDKFASLDRKIIELYDDLMSQVSHTSASKVLDEKKTGKQDSIGKLYSNVDSLSEQFAEQNEKVKHIAKGMSELDDKVTHLKQDMSLYRRQVDNKRGDDELVSLVAEQLIKNEDLTGWKMALKEIHAALNKQSEINTSVHHSYATLDKRTEAISQKVQLHGRLSVGAFSKKTTTPPSLQVTIDEEPVPLLTCHLQFNSSGKSPSNHRISVISSAPKYQPPAARLKGEGTGSWRPGSSLTGAVLIPAHSRISISPTSTAPGTRLSVEGYLELFKMY
ncbi:hypothetical protein AWC38_SpisGene17754 [Stylophora pistillata]|uniref:Uncharacterized protein n=1 Tax=Stylophora pistillata TaxID=50429 RepID=A0A2B4RL63_STYPI|nr:hypothetical protein AWC38_SpisGene17754 [Stylophora pistillata]